MSEDYKVQASFKFGQNQQAMLNVRGESVQEVGYHLGEAAEGAFVTALTHLDTTLQAGSALAPVTSPAAPPAYVPPQQGYQPPAAPPPAAAPQGKSCPHGARQFKTGVGAKGPWAAWFCPLPKGSAGACGPEWDRA